MGDLFTKKQFFTSTFILISLSAICYINTISNEFVFDDISHIVENNQLKDPAGIFRFIQGRRSIKHIFLLVEYQLWGLNPSGYHITNLLLHILNTISLYFLLINIFPANRVPFITGLLFATHPVHAEAVAAISNRTDLLAMFFFVWAYIFYLKRERSIWLFFFSNVSFSLALLSKESAVVSLPVMLIFHDSYFCESNRWTSFKKNFRYYIPYGLLIFLFLLYVVFTYQLMSPPSSIITHKQEGLFHFQSLPIFYTACTAFFKYLQLLLLPINLNVEHLLLFRHSFFDGVVLISITSIIFFSIIVIKFYTVSKVFTFGMVWFFVTIFPISNLLVPVTPYLTQYFVAERYLYLPSAGFCMVIAIIINKLMNTSKTFILKIPIKQTAFFILIIILCLYSGLTINRNTDWHSSLALWSKTVKQSPNSFLAHNNLGLVYLKRGEFDKAEVEFKKSLQINPNYVLPSYNIGIVYLKKELPEKAIIEFEKTLDIEPFHIKTLLNLGMIYEEKGLNEKAIENFKKILKLQPDHIYAHYYLGNIFLNMGLANQAIMEYKKALKVDPDLPEAVMKLGIAYSMEGDPEEAVKIFTKALRLKSDDASVHYNLANVYMDLGLFNQAIAEYQETLNINPDFIEALINLGVVYSRIGLNEQAVESLKKSLRLMPDDASAHYNLGNVYIALDLSDLAIAEYKEAKNLDPSLSYLSLTKNRIQKNK